MTEAENLGVYLEAATPDADGLGVAQVETEKTEVQSQETDQAMNFRKLREQNEQIRQESEQTRQMNLALQEELLKRSAPTPKQEPDEFADVANDDWLTYEQNQRLLARNAKQQEEKTALAIQNALEEAEIKRKKEEAPQRLKSLYSDINAVVTRENCNKLRELKPHLAKALSLIGDEEQQAIAAYEYIQQFLLKAPEPEKTQAQKRIETNASQPKSLSSAGANSPLSQAISFEEGLTPELKRHLAAEMAACARQG